MNRIQVTFITQLVRCDAIIDLLGGVLSEVYVHVLTIAFGCVWLFRPSFRLIDLFLS